VRDGEPTVTRPLSTAEAVTTSLKIRHRLPSSIDWTFFIQVQPTTTIGSGHHQPYHTTTAIRVSSPPPLPLYPQFFLSGRCSRLPNYSPRHSFFHSPLLFFQTAAGPARVCPRTIRSPCSSLYRVDARAIALPHTQAKSPNFPGPATFFSNLVLHQTPHSLPAGEVLSFASRNKPPSQNDQNRDRQT
jgi:hypothetical protein